jgi:hypothetical protein
VNPADAESLRKIPVGFAQETALTRNQANSLIGRLENKGLIPRDTFRVRLFRDGEKQKVAIVHEEGKGNAPQPVDTDRAKLPTVADAAELIEDQPNYRHSIDLLAQHFLGRTVSSNTEAALYHTLRDILFDAQQAIVKKHGGKFTTDRVRRRKYYQWS